MYIMNVIEGLLKIRFYLYGCTSKISEFSSEKLFLLLLLQTCKISEFSSEKLSLLLLLQTSHNLPSFIYIVFYVDWPCYIANNVFLNQDA